MFKDPNVSGRCRPSLTAAAKVIRRLCLSIRETILRNRRHADGRRRDDACFGAAAINHRRSLSALGIPRIVVAPARSPGSLTKERSERIG